LLIALVSVEPAAAQCGPAGGLDNTACGAGTLASTPPGNDNSAFGAGALFATTGSGNTASGAAALSFNTIGKDNTASGFGALYSNTTGKDNTASGAEALELNATGNNNTAIGTNALVNNTTGGGNIGLGINAGKNIVTGSSNIDIGNGGTGSDTNTIRIGIQGTQTRTYIAGVSGIISGGSESTELAVNRTTGQIGVIPSSARYKRDIHDMGGASTDLMKLRPVTFRYKGDPEGTLQYGLVAEEVARVYPELVVHDDDGKVQSVRYLEFTALLVNELQKQNAKVAAQQREIDALKQQNASINALSERLTALERQAKTSDLEGLRSLVWK
jgi:hypothetical protein